MIEGLFMVAMGITLTAFAIRKNVAKTKIWLQNPNDERCQQMRGAAPWMVAAYWAGLCCALLGFGLCCALLGFGIEVWLGTPPDATPWVLFSGFFAYLVLSAPLFFFPKRSNSR